jgi:CHAT domain-containing protein
VAPAQKLIPRGARVAVIPSGSLYDLNFETLLVPGPPLHYWIEDVVVTNASSLLLLRGAVSEKSNVTNRKLLLIGDPVSSGYSRLLHASEEISEVKKYFPADQVQVFASKDATARAYLDGDPQEFSLIHFVAHGVASRESPLDSAVILSGDESSNKLYARDIVAGKRLRATLVTISSCEGASGQTYAGEGLVGLSWAFLRAGAHQVVAALWDVNDASTAQFMSGFYRQLNAGKDPAVALRGAKLAMLHSDSIYHRPFYWAPFQLYKGL